MRMFSDGNDEDEISAPQVRRREPDLAELNFTGGIGPLPRHDDNSFNDVAQISTAAKEYPELFELWRGLWPAMVPESNVAAVFETLIARYEEKHRAYHIVSHLQDLCTRFVQHRHLFGADADAVLLAIFYHDAVYNAEPGKDEQASIALLYKDTSQHLVADNRILRAGELIGFTATHDAPETDFVARLFLDMDMSILAADANVYDRYAANVSKEFSTHYTSAQFTLGRLNRFIIPTLKKERIFLTPQYEPLEIMARGNLVRERGQLQQRADLDKLKHP